MSFDLRARRIRVIITLGRLLSCMIALIRNIIVIHERAVEIYAQHVLY